jgi:hypothetical protein
MTSTGPAVVSMLTERLHLVHLVPSAEDDSLEGREVFRLDVEEGEEPSEEVELFVVLVEYDMP